MTKSRSKSRSRSKEKISRSKSISSPEVKKSRSRSKSKSRSRSRSKEGIKQEEKYVFIALGYDILAIMTNPLGLLNQKMQVKTQKVLKKIVNLLIMLKQLQTILLMVLL